MATEEDFEANKVLVEGVCSEPANSECADCGANGTRWATVNHGLFVCIRCSGIHRSLGTHISKVKSTNLDKWTRAEISVMQMIGNKNGRALLEARVPKGEKPTPEESDGVVRDFIIRKYDEKKYAVPDWVPTLKKVFKSSGYKGYKLPKSDESEKKQKKEKKSKEQKKAEEGEEGKNESSSGGEKKSKKDKRAQMGLFGTVTVADDVHDETLATVLQHFGISPPPVVVASASTSATAATGEGEEGKEAEAATTATTEEEGEKKEE